MPEQVLLRDFASQGAVYDGLMRTLEAGTFVHAYLISGMAGVGKRTLAGLMAQYLVCTGEHRPCGKCPACVQAVEGTHPDIVSVRPGFAVNSDQPGRSKNGIAVDEIREVVRLCGEHTYAGGRRIVRIEQAEKMNPSAQNALLKTLEEPIEGTVFLLLTDSPSLLLQTIISRCRQLKLHGWPDEMIAGLLADDGVAPERIREAVRVCGGSIGQARALASDEAYWQRREAVMRDFFALDDRSGIIRVSNAWKDKRDSAEELLDDLTDMIRTLMLVNVGQLDEQAVNGYPPAWHQVARKADNETFAHLLDALSEARRLRMNQVTWQAVVERLLLRLMEEKNRWSM